MTAPVVGMYGWLYDHQGPWNRRRLGNAYQCGARRRLRGLRQEPFTYQRPHEVAAELAGWTAMDHQLLATGVKCDCCGSVIPRGSKPVAQRDVEATP